MDLFQKRLEMIKSLGWEVNLEEIISPSESKSVYQAHASQDNIYITGVGETRELAINDLLDKIVDATR